VTITATVSRTKNEQQSAPVAPQEDSAKPQEDPVKAAAPQKEVIDSPAKTAKSAAPKSTSKTYPQHPNNLKKIMQLDALLAARNENFETSKAAYIDAQKTRMSNLTPAEIKGLEEAFTRRYYAPEFDALAEYAVLQKERDELMAKEKLVSKDKVRLNELNFYHEMGAEGYAASAMFSDKSLKRLRSEQPDVEKELNKAISAQRRAYFHSVPVSQGNAMAIATLFDKRYPNVINELKDQAKSSTPGWSKGGAAALALLKTASALSNPSGFLVSRAVGAILRTPTFAPMVTKVSNGVRYAVEASGLAGPVKKVVSKWGPVSFGRVAAGVACVGAVGLLALGLVEPDDAMSLMADMKAGVLDWYNGLDPDVAFASSNSLTDHSQLMFDQALETPDMQPVDSVDMASNPVPAPDVAPDVTPGSALVDDDAPSPAIYAAFDPDALSANIDAMLDVEQMASRLDGPSSLGDFEDFSPKLDSNFVDMNLSGGEVVSPLPQVAEIPTGVPDVTPDAPLTSYTIKPGDTLSEIVEEQLKASGTPYNYALIDAHVQQIALANGISDPDVIYAGKTLSLPGLETAEPMVPVADHSAMLQASLTPDPQMHTPRVVEQIASLSQAPTIDATLHPATSPVAPMPVSPTPEQASTYNPMAYSGASAHRIRP